MAHSPTIGRELHYLSLMFCIGCSAAGSSGSRTFDVRDDSEPAASRAGQASPAVPVGSRPPSGGVPSTPVESTDPSTCVPARSALELVRQPVDIIIALDNSASMDDEARAVENNLNSNFAAILNQSQIDYRVIVISEHRERNVQDSAVCILGPLSTLTACPSDEPGPNERFFQYSTEVGSRNSFEVLLESFTGERADDFDLAPSGWSEWLRPGARKVFLEITDDDENTSALEFMDSLTALAPEQFGADPSQVTFVWHSIVGLAERPIVTDPYVPADPIEDRECSGDALNAGETYQELSRLTGGLRFPICELDGYDAVFRRVASDVILGSGGDCEFALPEPPPGRVLDLDEMAVSFTPSSGGAARLLGRVESAADCSLDGFVLDGTGVQLCSDVCELVRADARAALEVVFTCDSTLGR
jgi:hypothetical protein